MANPAQQAERNFADEAALGQLLAGYGAAIDWLDWARLHELFWPDSHFDFGAMFTGPLSEYRNFVVALEEGYSRRLHMFTAPLIDITGDRGRIDSGAIIVCRTENEGFGSDDVFFGRYVFEAARRDGVWKLSGLAYLLNLLDHRDRDADDSGLPINFAQGLTPAHALSRASWFGAR